MNSLSKIAKVSQYLNTGRIILVYGELCRQQGKGQDTFSARFECAKHLVKKGVNLKGFARYQNKQGRVIVASVKQETRLLSNGWSKVK